MEHDGTVFRNLPGAAPSSRGTAGDTSTPLNTRERLASQLSSSSFSELAQNPFFTAGFGLAALGIAARLGTRCLSFGAHLLRRRLLVEVEITRYDKSYQWFLQWMSAYQRAQLDAPKGLGLVDRLLRRMTPGAHHLSMDTSEVILPNGVPHTRFSLVPGPGRHILRYGRAFLAVSREREATSMDLREGKPFESIKITTLRAHRHILASIFQEARNLVAQSEEGKTIIYTSWSTEWRPFGQPKPRRPLSSVVLAEGVKEKIVQDVMHFQDSRQRYIDLGIPYRRGYLLYGPPGTGKTSFIEALAGELGLNIAIVNLSERGLTDDRLNHLLQNLPKRTLALLEDADAAVPARAASDGHGYAGANVTFSGLLNALDGVASGYDRITFLTTNHVERLDPALIRPGRVDVRAHLGFATEGQMGALFDRFYGEHDDGSLRKEFLEKAEDLGLEGRVSTAALQALFLQNETNARGAIEGAGALLSNLDVTDVRAGMK